MRKPFATSLSKGRGKKENGENCLTLPVFPTFIQALLSTDALSDPCSSSGGNRGMFIASRDAHGSLQD